MASRRLSVQIVGDSRSLQQALGKGGAAGNKFGKQLDNVHVRARKSFGGITASAAKMGVGVVGAYASIAGAKKAISTTEDLAKATIGLHKNLGLTIEQASRWAAVAKARGIDAKQLAQGFGTLSKNAVAVSIASGKQQKSLDALGKSQADLKKGAALAAKGLGPQADAFKKLGLSARDVAGANTDFQGFLSKVADGFGKMHGGSEKAALGMKLFGKGWQTVLPVLRGGSKAMNEQLALADKYGVTFRGKTVKSLEDLIAAQRESKFATMGLQVAFGTQLAPALTKAIQAFTQFIANLRSGGGAFAQVRSGINSVVAAYKTYIQAVSLPAVRVSFDWLKVNAPPAFDAIKSGTTTAISAVKRWVADNRAQIAQVIQAFKNVAVVVRTVLGAAFNIALATVRRALPGIKMIVQGQLKIISGIVKVFAGLLTGDFRGAWNGVKSIFSGAAKVVVGMVRAMTAPIREAASRAGKGIASGFRAAIGGARSAVTSLAKGAVAVLHSWGARFLELGKNLIQGLVNGIKSKAEDVANAAKNVAKGAVDGVKGFLHIKSPSKVFEQIGTFVSQGLAQGIEGGKSMVDAAVNAGLLFPLDAAITQLNAQKEKLQASFDAWDSRRSRQDLVTGIATAGQSDAGGASGGGLSWAKQMVGHFKESTGSNTGPELDKLQKDFGTHAAAWCAEFATTALVKAGAPKELKTASVAQIRAWATAGTHGLEKGVKSTGRAGDLWMRGNEHVGVVEKIVNGVVHTIEGNTSGKGGVTRRTHKAGEGDFARVAGFGGAGSAAGGKTSLASLWKKAGGDPKVASLMAAIAMAESGGKAGAVNKSSGATGLWQILGKPFKGNAKDPLTNAKMAVSKFKSQGLGAWEAYTKGTYKGFLGKGGSVNLPGMTGGVKGGDGGSIADAIKGLKDFDRETARTKKLAAIDMKIKGLEALKAYKDAVADLGDQFKDMAASGASAWRGVQEAAIDAQHAGALAAIAGSGPAAELLGLQAQDKAEQDARSERDLKKAVEDAQFLVGHSGGKAKIEAQQQLEDAQKDLASFYRKAREDDLQEWIDNETKKADESSEAQKGALDQQEIDYRTSLQNQFNDLLTNLENRKIGYADFVKQVNAIMAPLGGEFKGSAEQEAAVGGVRNGIYNSKQANAFGVKLAAGWGIEYKDGQATRFLTPAQMKSMGFRAKGGPVTAGSPYMVGEEGPEVFVPRSSGTVVPNKPGSRSGGWGDVMLTKNGNINLRGTREARRELNRLAFRVATA